MLAALEQHKRSVQWQTPALIVNMTTWIRQERWLQELPELPQPRRWCEHEPACQHSQEHTKRVLDEARGKRASV